MTRFKPIKQVLVVYKQSALDVALPHLPKSARSRLQPLLKKYQTAHQEHEATKKLVRSTLQNSGVDFLFTKRRQPPRLGNYDLIITLGGDGTLLHVSHQVTSTPVLAINSSPSLSVGALCQMTAESFALHWKNISLGHYRISSRQRIEVQINQKQLNTLALNDVLFSSLQSGGTSRYEISVGNIKETQVSSGVWIATASGSTGVIRSAGGRQITATSSKIQYLVREPYLVKQAYQLKMGFLQKSKPLKITNHTLSGALFIDGQEIDIPLKMGDQVLLKPAKLALKLVCNRSVIGPTSLMAPKVLPPLRGGS